MAGKIMNFIYSVEEISELKRKSAMHGITASDLCRAAIRIGMKAIDDNPQLLREQATRTVVPV